MKVLKERIWFCKIGGVVGDLPWGADGPMRQAIQEAYFRLTGQYAEFCFSGWAGELDNGQRAVVEQKRKDNGN